MSMDIIIKIIFDKMMVILNLNNINNFKIVMLLS
jgi:hypothetical protein